MFHRVGHACPFLMNSQNGLINSWFFAVGYCEVDVQVSTDVGAADPDDKLLAQQWDMVHVTAPLAWQNGFTGTSAIRVCMIDTGVDYTHPDLQGNLWINPTESAGAAASSANGYKNGIDDDGDGKLHIDTVFLVVSSLALIDCIYPACVHLSQAAHLLQPLTYIDLPCQYRQLRHNQFCVCL